MPGFRSQNARERSLLAAVKANDVELVRSILDSSNGEVCIDERDSSDRTGLMISSESGYVDIMRLFLKSNSNLEAKHRRGCTALHLAAEAGQDSCVAALIQAGARVNAVDLSGSSPLLLAAKNCRGSGSCFKVMKHLIEAQCDLEKRDAEERTALHYTSYRGIGCELLLSAGASPDVQDCDGNTPLHLAAIEGFDPIIRCLTTYNCNPNLVNHAGKMAVHYLAMKGHGEAIEDIARISGNLDHADSTGMVPLLLAVTHRRTAAVTSLLLSNCSPDPPPHDHGVVALGEAGFENVGGSTALFPIHVALANRHYDIAQQLLLAGCRLDALQDIVSQYRARRQESESRALSAIFSGSARTAIETVDEEEEAAMSWFIAWLKYPPSLKQSCRVRIRACLRPGAICSAIKALSRRIPTALQQYVSLSELEDIRKDQTFLRS